MSKEWGETEKITLTETLFVGFIKLIMKKQKDTAPLEPESLKSETSQSKEESKESRIDLEKADQLVNGDLGERPESHQQHDLDLRQGAPANRALDQRVIDFISPSV